MKQYAVCSKQSGSPDFKAITAASKSDAKRQYQAMHPRRNLKLSDIHASEQK